MILSDTHSMAAELMTRFADRTGLTSSKPPRRYLWTDAFAVCNYLGLARVSGEKRFVDLALRLVEQVHHVLGRHRPDDSRSGWISGLGEPEGEAHPTRGGLRIGKELPERSPGELGDPQLEWDRDGQYFHYLTKWMHALDQVSRETGDPKHNRWARELAETSHRAFTYAPDPGARKRMHWKMSIDLSRPLVDSMGQHDPLDGWITCLQLAASPAGGAGSGLAAEIAGLARLCEGLDLETNDPLGLGGLMADAFKLDQVHRGHDSTQAVLDAAASGLEFYLRELPFEDPPGRRLAFRELGLSIGLHAVRLMAMNHRGGAASPGLMRIHRYTPLSERIETCWKDHKTSEAWLAHQDINEVMLATSLAPEGFLVLR
jgi:hypothetical protein